MKVFAVVVCYEPEIATLSLCLESICKQVDRVIIFNNGSKINYNFSQKVEVINSGENIGIAEAQNISMIKAFSQGADFVLQSDQDSIFPSDYISKLLESYMSLTEGGINVGVIGGTPCSYSGKKSEVRDKAEFSFYRESLSSGSLFSKDIFEKVGLFRSELFIDLVDHDFCWRLNALGYKTIRCNLIEFKHQSGQRIKTLFGKKVVLVPSVLRHYYHSRNVIYLSRFDYVPISWKIKQNMKLLFKLILYPFIFKDGFTRCRMILSGISAGFLNKMGRKDF